MSYHSLVPADFRRLTPDKQVAEDAIRHFAVSISMREELAGRVYNKSTRAQALAELFCLGVVHAVTGPKDPKLEDWIKSTTVCDLPEGIADLPPAEQAKRAYFIGRLSAEKASSQLAVAAMANAVDNLLLANHSLLDEVSTVS